MDVNNINENNMMDDNNINKNNVNVNEDNANEKIEENITITDFVMVNLEPNAPLDKDAETAVKDKQAIEDNNFNIKPKKTKFKLMNTKKLLIILLVVVVSSASGSISSIVTYKYLNNKTAPAVVNTTATLPMVSQISSNTKGLTATEIAKKVTPAVVSITTDLGMGTGFIFNEDGYILTNYHVISGSNKISVLLSTNQTSKAKLINYDANLDLAVIKLTDKVKIPGIVELGDSSTVQVGEDVVAIGNPLGTELISTVTKGIVSAVNRKIVGAGKTEQTYIQTDTAINSGNSGGPLLNSYGQVIGINSEKIGGTGVEGIGFAIPIDIAKNKIPDLIKPLLKIGIYTADITKQLAEENNLPEGIYVKQVQEFGAAEKAGLRPGDVITKIDNQSVKTTDDVNKIKATHKTSDTLSITIIRNNKEVTISLILE